MGGIKKNINKMALTNAQGHYLKIEYVEIDRLAADIYYSIYEDVNDRAAEVDKDKTSFKTAVKDKILTTTFIFSQDAGKSLLDNIKTGAYLTLKAGDFKTWSDA